MIPALINFAAFAGLTIAIGAVITRFAVLGRSGLSATGVANSLLNPFAVATPRRSLAGPPLSGPTRERRLTAKKRRSGVKSMRGGQFDE